MLITDSFVFLHLPKTGGTFVTTVLKKVEEQINNGKILGRTHFKELTLPNIKWVRCRHQADQHGTYQQIPSKYLKFPIISVIRNPFDRYVSTYEFQNWIRNPAADLEAIIKLLPTYPELSFGEYLNYLSSFDLCNRPGYEQLKVDIGVQTFQFIQMFFKDPLATIKKMDESYLKSDEYVYDMPEITFLRMENLNQELFDILIKFGYPQNKIEFILEEKKIFPPGSSRNDLKNWQQYYNRDTYEFVKHKERLLLKLFPEYNIPFPVVEGDK